MPIYEYQCSKCGTLEVFQRITDHPLVRCPTCRSKLTKLISKSSFQLKGTGWYLTDYAAKGRNGTRHQGAGEPESKTVTGSESSSSSAAAGSSAANGSSKKPSLDAKASHKSSGVGLREG
jgi:putative FmdB family regulatory protein